MNYGMAKGRAGEKAPLLFVRYKLAFFESHVGAARSGMPPLTENIGVVTAKSRETIH